MEAIKNAVALQDHYARKFQFLGLKVARKKPRIRTLTNRPKKPKMKLEGLNYKQIVASKYKGVEKYALENRGNKYRKYLDNLSLAQKRGLVQKPPEPLKSEQWYTIVETAKSRLKKSSSCSICMEQFGISTQVVLSCTHVFHKNCLNSFEKYNRNNQTIKKCPLCRFEDYEKSPFVEGTRIYIEIAASKLQATIRMRLKRVEFMEKLNQIGKLNLSSKRLKESLVVYNLDKTLNRITNSINKKARYLKNTSEGIDSLKDKHIQLMEDYEANVERLLRKRHQDTNLMNLLEELMEKEIFRGYGFKEQAQLKNWKASLARASSRTKDDCPICISPLGEPKSVVLTSCSHLFHGRCLISFEEFSQRKECPLCRERYKRISLTKLKQKLNK